MKFVMTQAVCHEGMQLLDGIADVYVADNQDPNNYLDEMRDAAALIVRIAKCDANAIENSPKLKVIGRTGVGYDSVDVKKSICSFLVRICACSCTQLPIQRSSGTACSPSFKNSAGDFSCRWSQNSPYAYSCRVLVYRTFSTREDAPSPSPR